MKLIFKFGKLKKPMGMKVYQDGVKLVNSLNNVQRLCMQLQPNKLNRTTLLTCLSNYELQCQIFKLY
jgi:hypothetical protein